MKDLVHRFVYSKWNTFS